MKKIMKTLPLDDTVYQWICEIRREWLEGKRPYLDVLREANEQSGPVRLGGMSIGDLREEIRAIPIEDQRRVLDRILIESDDGMIKKLNRFFSQRDTPTVPEEALVFYEDVCAYRSSIIDEYSRISVFDQSQEIQDSETVEEVIEKINSIFQCRKDQAGKIKIENRSAGKICYALKLLDKHRAPSVLERFVRAGGEPLTPEYVSRAASQYRAGKSEETEIEKDWIRNQLRKYHG